MQVHDQLARMDAQQLRVFAADLIETLANRDRELHHKQLKIEQLTHEMAVLKRWKFAARSEQLHGAQRSLLDETIDADLEAIATSLRGCPRNARAVLANCCRTVGYRRRVRTNQRISAR